MWGELIRETDSGGKQAGGEEAAVGQPAGD